jgi:hypothetical protein
VCASSDPHVLVDHRGFGVSGQAGNQRLALRNFVVLPFNIDHAMSCGLFIRNMARDIEDDRVRVKDDFKLVAQCVCESISHLLSEDAGTLAKYLRRATDAGLAGTRAVLLRDGFDPSWFENGQTRLVP